MGLFSRWKTLHAHRRFAAAIGQIATPEEEEGNPLPLLRRVNHV
jgi:hypothetical protein